MLYNVKNLTWNIDTFATVFVKEDQWTEDASKERLWHG